VAIGITNRSYGYFHFNRREQEAQALLNNDATDPEIRRDLEHELVPGTNLNTGWLLAMEALHRRLGAPADLRPDYHRYRLLQAVYCYHHYYLDGTVTAEDLVAARKRIGFKDRVWLGVGARIVGPLARRLPARVRSSMGRLFDLVLRQQARGKRPQEAVGRYRNMLELIEHPPVELGV